MHVRKRQGPAGHKGLVWAVNVEVERALSSTQCVNLANYDATVVFIDTDGDTGREMSIKLTGLYDLTADDFIL